MFVHGMHGVDRNYNYVILLEDDKLVLPACSIIFSMYVIVVGVLGPRLRVVAQIFQPTSTWMVPCMGCAAGCTNRSIDRVSRNSWLGHF
jgi:hypothetical protein